MDILAHNRAAWDQKVEQQDRWTRPVPEEVIERARRGEFELLLTPTKPVPMSWFPELKGIRRLCLASGGGQQGPLLAAAGAVVTVFDNSPKQLNQDRLVAEREGLAIETVEGDMANPSAIAGCCSHSIQSRSCHGERPWPRWGRFFDGPCAADYDRHSLRRGSLGRCMLSRDFLSGFSAESVGSFGA